MVSSLITSWAIDPLRSSIGGSGVGFILEGQMNDVLENHKIYGGLLAMTDLRSGDIFLEYEFLKYLLDFNVRVDRRVLMQPLETQEKFKYILNEAEFEASLPLNVSTRIAAGPIFGNSRFLAITNSSLLNYSGNTDQTDVNTFYAGAKVEMVYDNTIVKGFNLYNGTLARAEYRQIAGLGDPEMGFGKLTLEAKNYFPISRDFILATRGYAGSFVGNSTPNFILGGVDNWIFNKTEESEVNDPFYADSDRPETENRDLLFHEFVTPMRGFSYNAFNGKNVLLLNAELRFPLIKYFYRGPISSNFFRNLQVVGFYDIGSSWTGTPPFLRNNSINTVPKLNPQSPFRAVIQNYKNPWLSSFGFGARTVLLGYYVKFDVAYPMEDYQVDEPRFFLSFGYDF
jgi:outer membrane protein assembly factor BamA